MKRISRIPLPKLEKSISEEELFLSLIDAQEERLNRVTGFNLVQRVRDEIQEFILLSEIYQQAQKDTLKVRLRVT